MNPLEAELIGVSFSYDINEAYYIPVAHKNVKSLDKEFVVKKIKKILEDPSIKKIVDADLRSKKNYSIWIYSFF